MMDSIVIIIELIGAWLLFAAPLLQATLELHEENESWDAIKNKHRAYHQPIIKKSYFLWWLIPPLKILFEKRRIRKIKHLYSDVKLSSETTRRLHRYGLKANGWSGVTLGGWCIAVSTSWDVTKHFNLPIAIWLCLILSFSFISTLINMKLTFKHLTDS